MFGWFCLAVTTFGTRWLCSRQYNVKLCCTHGRRVYQQTCLSARRVYQQTHGSLHVFYQNELLSQAKASISSCGLSLQTYRQNCIEKVKRATDAVWSGDGRFDSMGHSAKYGVHSMFSSSLMKIVHFEIVQVRLWHKAVH